MEIIKEDIENIVKKELINIVENGLITTVFQPIISLRDGSILGSEALSRGPEGTEMQNPELLFNYAIKYDMLWTLELLCRTKSLQSLQKSKIKTKLFLNVNPNTINDSKFKKGFTRSHLTKFSIEPDSIIFEITEKGTIDNIDDFRKTVENYKDQNYKIAIDDAGAGLSGLNMISDINPHYIKLDMHLIRDIDKNPTKQALIKSMVEFANLSNTFLIAEGIETKQELLKLIEIGVNYGQGYFIQKPNHSILPIKNEVIEIIKDANKKKNHLIGNKISDIFISNICTSLRTLNSSIPIFKVHDMMNQDPTIPGFCITEEDKLLGVVTRGCLYSALSGQYGFSLYSTKSISTIMSKEFLNVNFDDPIDKVSQMAMQRTPDKLYDFVTVTKNNKYLGIVTVKDLLENTIKIEVNAAKHLNPISGLPGNLIIERHLERILSSKEKFKLLYLDIDNFKAYNDVYGFEKGDIVIRTLAQIMKETIPKDEFIGHIGGDDFISILSCSNIDEICNSVIKKFDQSILDFYNEVDLDKGFIVTKNRHGIEETFPLLSISIAGVISTNCNNIYDISKKASEIKKQCKQCSGSICIIV